MARAVLIDANLLVLFVVGSAGRTLISRHKRLRAFSEADFDLLTGLLAQASEVILTPNVLTEASNLVRQTEGSARERIQLYFQSLIGRVREIYVESARAASRPEFLRLGLADSSLLEIAAEDVVVLTADFDLYRAALSAGRPAMNFNHVRDNPDNMVAF